MKHILKTTSYFLLGLTFLIHCDGADKSNSFAAPDTYDLSFVATDAMQEFLSHPKLRSSYDDIDRARAIVELLFGSDGSGFEYEPDLTLAPAEAFEQRKGNCVTFAMLFTTLARSVGLRTHFNEIITTPSWNRNGDLVVETGHVNVVVTSGWRTFLVEWLDTYRDLSMISINPSKDDKIRSDFLNNLAIQALAKKDYETTKLYLKAAKELYPKNAGVWQNEGVMWIHLGNMEKAEAAFLKGLKHSGKRSSIYFLLSKLYEKQNKLELSEKYLEKGKRYAQQNPFYHYERGMEEFEEQSFDKALKHLDRAIKKLPDYHLFHYMKAKCYLALGEEQQWGDSMQKAISHSRSPDTQQRYQMELLKFSQNDDGKAF